MRPPGGLSLGLEHHTLPAPLVYAPAGSGIYASLHVTDSRLGDTFCPGVRAMYALSTPGEGDEDMTIQVAHFLAGNVVFVSGRRGPRHIRGFASALEPRAIKLTVTAGLGTLVYVLGISPSGGAALSAAVPQLRPRHHPGDRAQGLRAMPRAQFAILDVISPPQAHSAHALGCKTLCTRLVSRTFRGVSPHRTTPDLRVSTTTSAGTD